MCVCIMYVYHVCDNIFFFFFLFSFSFFFFTLFEQKKKMSQFCAVLAAGRWTRTETH